MGAGQARETLDRYLAGGGELSEPQTLCRDETGTLFLVTEAGQSTNIPRLSWRTWLSTCLIT